MSEEALLRSIRRWLVVLAFLVDIVLLAVANGTPLALFAAFVGVLLLVRLLWSFLAMFEEP
ncbi:hypothetical protein U3A55_15105 [Salarchaeum sp. III]|uniref:hypothetical protein n=1 Tax=Salarchaeum sp. III TaxID=3107927 RepID=UPI002ED97703